MRGTYLHYRFFCQDRNHFLDIARKYNSTGWSVYQVAYGKRAQTVTEFVFFQSFIGQGY